MIENYPTEEKIDIIQKLKQAALKEYNENADLTEKICSRKDVTESKPCPKCGVYYSKTNLFRHAKKCMRPKLLKRKLQCLSTEIHLRNAKLGLNERATKVVANLKEEGVRQIVLSDKIIKEYTNYLSNKFKFKHLDNHIRSRIILLAKFVHELRAINKSLNNLEDLFTPKDDCLKNVFGDAITAIEKVGGFTKTGCRAHTRPNGPNQLFWGPEAIIRPEM
uniref:Uncharacterized protein n=1 Tax=Cacopsylla melanoneura TaxID=428564 RepID=A0A8D8X789_9HEMI